VIIERAIDFWFIVWWIIAQARLVLSTV